MNTVSTHTAIMYLYLSAQSVCMYVCMNVWMFLCMCVCMVGLSHNTLIVPSLIYVVFDADLYYRYKCFLSLSLLYTGGFVRQYCIPHLCL